MIIMNQIFKVVYSAAKQCYVVTSEFAKSNGKKASIVAAALVLTSAVGAVNAADTMESRVSTLESRLERTIEKTNQDIAALTTIVKNTSDEQVATNKQKSEANEAAITALTNKVNTLEAGAGASGTKDQEQDTKIQANTDKVTAHDTAINDLTPKVTKNTEDLAKVDGKIDGAREAAVTEAGEKISAAKTELEGKINDAKTAAIADADGKLGTAKTELEGKINDAKAAAIADADGKLGTAKTELEGKITDLEAKYNSATDIKAANDRFEKLEQADKNHNDTIGTINTNILGIKKDILGIKTKMEEDSNDIDIMAGNIESNAQAIDANTAAIDKNTTAVDEANKKLADHEKVINDNTTAINNNVDSINTNAESIAKNTGYIKEIVEKSIELGGVVNENKENITKVATGLIKASEEIDALRDKDTALENKNTTQDGEITKAQKAAEAADTKAVEAKKAADVADTKAAEAQKEAKAAAKAATEKSEKAKTDAVTEAGTKADEKVAAAKTELEGKIDTAKTEAITEAGTKADEKVAAAKTELGEKLKGLDNTTVKLEKYDKDIAALQEKDKNHEARLTTVEQDVKTVGANAAALAALKPLQYNPGQTTQVMAGVGTYRGKTAVALGAAHYASENLMYHAGVSFGNGSGTMANAGITIGFGSGETAKAESPKVAQLQSAVDRLTAENEQVKAALYDIYAKLQAK